MARHGGKRLGAGRPKGTPNKANAELREAAQAYGLEIIERLAAMAANAESESVRLAAMRELLDRGYGRPPAGLEIDHGIQPENPLAEILKAAAAKGPFECLSDPDSED